MAKSGIIFNPSGESALPVTGQMQREISSDTVRFALDNHTPSQRELLTVTSKLPTPRKGNAGTVKNTIHFLKDLSVGTFDNSGQENYAPAIIRIETSFPVGTDPEILRYLAKKAASCTLVSMEDFTDFFVNGNLVAADPDAIPPLPNSN